jgi:alkylation response protein AidB-like acyl-CoA dehydrogenase
MAAKRSVKSTQAKKLATGEWVGRFGSTEPNHGSDPASIPPAPSRHNV